MQNIRLCPLLLIALITMDRSSRITSLYGVLNVTISNRQAFYLCHDCLVSSFGIEQIRLITATNAFGLYWIGCHSCTLKTLLSDCITRNQCVLSSQLTQTNRPADKTKPLRDTTEPSKLVGIYTLANAMDEVIMRNSGKSVTFSTETKYDVSSLDWQETSETTIFFWKEGLIEDAMPFYKTRQGPHIFIFSSPAVLDSSLRKSDRVSTQDNESSMRCIAVSSTLQEAVCRECLAMHSTRFAVRAFRLHHKSKKKSAEVYIFLSNYLSLEIVTNCAGTFCPQIMSLKLINCRIMHNLFIRNHRDADERNGMKLNEVRQVLQNIAYKRMARRHPLKGRFQEALADSGSLNILPGEEYNCIKVWMIPTLRSGCISCILKDVTGHRLVVTLSLYISLIFTDAFKPIPTCSACNLTEVLHPDDCRRDISHRRDNFEVYQKPSHFEMQNELDKRCLAVYHSKSEKIRCERCINNNLELRNEAQLIQSSPLLFDLTISIRKPSPEAFKSSISKCVQDYKCSRIQNVPYEFCAAHREFIMAQSIGRTSVKAFTQNRIPVGVWPPLESSVFQSMNVLVQPRSSVGNSRSAYTSQIWPASSNIALVEFEYTEGKVKDCLKCLVEHTEVFFFYRNEYTPKGYVWMRPAGSTIVSRCVGNHCTSLSYTNKMNTRRPVGQRQLTNVDIITSIGSFPNRKTS